MTLKPLNLDSNTKMRLTEALDPKLIKTRKSAGTELSYISGNTCIDLLNSVFGFCWTFEILDSKIVEADNQIIKQVQDWKTKAWSWPKGMQEPPANQVKIDGKGAKYVVMDNQGSIAWVLGKLTVPLQDENGNIIYVSKSAYGSQLITGPGQTQSMTGLKAAGTDALKKCATLFSLATELYRDPEEEEYFQELRSDYLPDTWTEDVIKQYIDQYNKLTDLLKEYNWSFDDLSYYVSLVTDGQYTNFKKMPAEYIDDILTAIEEE